MIGRLLTALVDVSDPAGVLVGQLVTERAHDDMPQLRLARPAAIRFASAAELLDPGYSPDAEAPGAAPLSLVLYLTLFDRLARPAVRPPDVGPKTFHVNSPLVHPNPAAPP